jgi:pyridoxal biosynthesis lyase PdxS
LLQNRRGLIDAVRVIAEGALKWRSFADRGIGQIAVGYQEFRRSVRELAQYGLAADRDNVIDVRDPRGPDHMLQLRARHELPACPRANLS